MDKAVNAVFACLIWHSQEIREELMPHGKMMMSCYIIPCFIHNVVFQQQAYPDYVRWDYYDIMLHHSMQPPAP